MTTIITGGTGNLGTTVSNSGPFDADNLNYTLTAALQSGSATLGAITPGYWQSRPECEPVLHCLGHFHRAWRHYDLLHRQRSECVQPSADTTASLTVLDHSNASLSSTATQTTADDQFRQRAARGGHSQPEFHDLQPGGEYHGNYTANLKLTGFTHRAMPP